MKILKLIGVGLLALVSAYLALALALVYWPADPFTGHSAPPTPALEDHPHSEVWFVMRDGKRMFARVFGAPADTAILLVHGFGVNSRPYEPASAAWNEATGARVIAIDLRGHGQSEGKPGRVDHFGQYEEDLADAISSLRKEGARQVILAGHSMGGGVVLTFALSATSAPDAYLLVSPLLGNNAPTAPASGGAAPLQSNFYVRKPRIFGVLMFTVPGIHAFDDLPIMYLNQTPPMTYSLNALGSMAPRDYRAAFRAIKAPLLLVAGSKDEVFRANAYADVVKQYSSGSSVLVDGATHVGVLTDTVAIAEIKSFAQSLHTSGASAK